MRLRRLIIVALLGMLACACSGKEETPEQARVTTTTVAPTTTTEPDVAAEACKDPTENADTLVASSNDRISEAARRYREAHSEALFSGDSEAMGREVTAAVDLRLACEAAGYGG
jgi:hypothetical protein